MSRHRKNRDVGIARGARMSPRPDDFLHPYISFPLHTTKRGYCTPLARPRIRAPNHSPYTGHRAQRDAILSRLMTKRGLQLGSEFLT